MVIRRWWRLRGRNDLKAALAPLHPHQLPRASEGAAPSRTISHAIAIEHVGRILRDRRGNQPGALAQPLRLASGLRHDAAHLRCRPTLRLDVAAMTFIQL